MASGADNRLYLYMQVTGNNVAANASYVSWWIELYVGFAVNARMTGNLTVNGTVMWNNGDFNPGYLAYGNTYRIAEGSFTVGHRSDGTAELAGTANLATRTQGQTWSFSKSASSSQGLPRLTYAPSSPGTPYLQSNTTSSITFAWAPPGDWGRDYTNRYLVRVYNESDDAHMGDFRISGTSFTSSPLLAGQGIYVYVAASNGTGDGAWSARSPVMRSRVVSPAVSPVITSVVRNSDISHTINWTLTSTPSAPVTSVIVQRTDCMGIENPWYTIATLPGTPTTYTDTSTRPDRVYGWMVYAVNSSGQVRSDPTKCWPTSPSAPHSVTASRRSNGQFITWGHAPVQGPGVTYTVALSTNNGTSWTTLATLISGLSYLDSTVRTSSVLYRVNATTSTYPVGPPDSTLSLVGPWSTSASVPALAPPGAPQNLLPDGAVRDAQETSEESLVWEYRSTDTSPQTAYAIRWREVGSGIWTDGGKFVSPDPIAPFPSEWHNGTTYEWAVRTWGLHADPSPWSNTAVVQMTRRPTATISVPSASSPVDSATATVVWTYWDEENTSQTKWVARLFDASGGLLETLSGAGAASSASFGFHVLNETAYSIEVVVTDGSGMDSLPSSVSFVVDYAAPGTPLAWTTWDDSTASVVLRISPGPSTVDTDYHDVYVSRDGGTTWYVLALGVPPEGAVTDVRPNLRGVTMYATRSVNTTLNTTTLTLPLISVDHREPRGLGVLSFGRSLENPVLVTCNLDASSTDARSKQLVHTSGNDFPLMIQAYYETQTVAVSGTVKVTGLQLEDLETRARSLGPAYWRDYLGRSFWCSVGEVSFMTTQSYEDPEYIYADMAVVLTRLASPETPVQL